MSHEIAFNAKTGRNNNFVGIVKIDGADQQHLGPGTYEAQSSIRVNMPAPDAVSNAAFGSSSERAFFGLDGRGNTGETVGPGKYQLAGQHHEMGVLGGGGSGSIGDGDNGFEGAGFTPSSPPASATGHGGGAARSGNRQSRLASPGRPAARDASFEDNLLPANQASSGGEGGDNGLSAPRQEAARVARGGSLYQRAATAEGGGSGKKGGGGGHKMEDKDRSVPDPADNHRPTPGPGAYNLPGIPWGHSTGTLKMAAAPVGLAEVAGGLGSASNSNSRQSKSVGSATVGGGAVEWMRVPTAPSIPGKTQSHGYEEGRHGELVTVQPSDPGHSGLVTVRATGRVVADTVGPLDYQAKPLNKNPHVLDFGKGAARPGLPGTGANTASAARPKPKPGGGGFANGGDVLNSNNCEGGERGGCAEGFMDEAGTLRRPNDISNMANNKPSPMFMPANGGLGSGMSGKAAAAAARAQKKVPFYSSPFYPGGGSGGGGANAANAAASAAVVAAAVALAVGEEGPTPGPGHYSLPSHLAVAAPVPEPLQFFGSTAPRFSQHPPRTVALIGGAPGPGAYADAKSDFDKTGHPKYNPLRPAASTVGFKSETARGGFLSPPRSTNAAVGPGSYFIPGLAQELSKRGGCGCSGGDGGGVGSTRNGDFLSTVPRFHSLVSQDQALRPGPATYFNSSFNENFNPTLNEIQQDGNFDDGGNGCGGMGGGAPPLQSARMVVPRQATPPSSSSSSSLGFAAAADSAAAAADNYYANSHVGRQQQQQLTEAERAAELMRRQAGVAHTSSSVTQGSIPNPPRGSSADASPALSSLSSSWGGQGVGGQHRQPQPQPPPSNHQQAHQPQYVLSTGGQRKQGGRSRFVKKGHGGAGMLRGSVLRLAEGQPATTQANQQHHHHNPLETGGGLGGARQPSSSFRSQGRDGARRQGGGTGSSAGGAADGADPTSIRRQRLSASGGGHGYGVKLEDRGQKTAPQGAFRNPQPLTASERAPAHTSSAALAASDPESYALFDGGPATVKGPDLGRQCDRFPVPSRHADQMAKVGPGSYSVPSRLGSQGGSLGLVKRSFRGVMDSGTQRLPPGPGSSSGGGGSASGMPGPGAYDPIKPFGNLLKPTYNAFIAKQAIEG